MLDKAIKLAVDSHVGQLDKGGNPYILHPLRVMLSMADEDDRICAVLHDVIEDSDVTLGDLKKQGFSYEVIRTVDCLTKKTGEKYESFLDRVLSDERAIRVKIADIEDNMDLTRIPNASQKDFDRIKKYEQALTLLKNKLP